MGSERGNKSGSRLLRRCCSFKSGKNNPIDFSRVFSETRLPFCTARLSYPQKRIAVARSEDAPGELVGSPATLLLGRDQATYPIAGEVLKDANTGQVFFTATLSGDAKRACCSTAGTGTASRKRWVAQVRNYRGKRIYGEFREFAADIAPAIAADYEAVQLSVFWGEEVTHLNAALKKRGAEGKRLPPELGYSQDYTSRSSNLSALHLTR